MNYVRISPEALDAIAKLPSRRDGRPHIELGGGIGLSGMVPDDGARVDWDAVNALLQEKPSLSRLELLSATLVPLVALIVVGFLLFGCARDDGMGDLWKGVKQVEQQR